MTKQIRKNEIPAGLIPHSLIHSFNNVCRLSAMCNSAVYDVILLSNQVLDMEIIWWCHSLKKQV